MNDIILFANVLPIIKRQKDDGEDGDIMYQDHLKW